MSAEAGGERTAPRRTDLALARFGTVLTWLPIVFAVAISVAGSVATGVVRFDVLAPAELFPIFVAGGALIVAAAFRSGRRRVAAATSVAAGWAFLIGSQAVAVMTGLADGSRDPTGWPWLVAAGAVVAYGLAVIVAGVVGWALARDLAAEARDA